MYKRPKRPLKPLKKYLILCEGKVTEALYLNGVRQEKRLSRDLIDVREAEGVPMSIVRQAVHLKSQNDLEFGHDLDAGFSETWCVFDRDEHPNVREAQNLAAKNGIGVAFSNPCFELFLLLHFQEYRRSEHRDRVSTALRKHIRNYDKHFDYFALDLSGKYPDARQRCEVINASSAIGADHLHQAPYCSLHTLIDKLRALSSSPFAVERRQPVHEW